MPRKSKPLSQLDLKLQEYWKERNKVLAWKAEGKSLEWMRNQLKN